VPVRIGKVLKTDLREWARVQHTTLAMSVFTAYVALVLRWCDVQDAVFRYQTDGRIVPGVENAIGFFASVLHLRIELGDDENFVDLLRLITQEHCSAYEHFDACYVESLLPVSEFTRNGRFNWLPQGSKSYSAAQGAAEFSYSPIRFTHPMLKKYDLDYEPGIVLHDIDEEVVGGAYFALNRFSNQTMERFGHNFMLFVNELLRRPLTPVRDIVLQ
jgi:non-ribosomal peptide synthetase component F